MPQQSSPVRALEIPCTAAPSIANCVRTSPPDTGTSETSGGPSFGDTNARLDPSGENAIEDGPEKRREV
ncbi:MAG TPA: hypothetical protein VK256_02850 [Candidatus Eisenbacteria bacterium]|nr:hypothetical protein [Candidatus Eisenbacteria bacterium]